MKVNPARRFKELEQENARLKRLLVRGGVGQGQQDEASHGPHCSRGVCLRGRLCAVQRGMSRQAHFRKMLDETGASALEIEWFVIMENARGLLPALAEAQLLHAYSHEHGGLARYNACV